MDAIPFDFRLTCRRGLNALLLVAPLVLSVLLLARRVAGALVEPLPLAGWLAIGLIVALWLRWSVTWLPGRFSPPLAGRLPIDWLAINWFAAAIAGMLGLALWLPGTGLAALACYAATVVVGSSPRIAVPWRRIWPERLRTAFRQRFETSDESGDDEPQVASSMPPAVVQQLIRRRDPGEAESLRGSLRADFVTGQRTASAHVAICPPFVSQPRCQVAVAAGPASEVRVASVLPFGVRFEIKLARAALEPASVVIEFAVDSTDADVP